MAGRARLTVAAALLAFSATGAAAGDVAALRELLLGEYNNNEQAWKAGVDGVAPVPRQHWRIAAAENGSVTVAMAAGQSAAEPAWTLSFDGDETPVRRFAQGLDEVCRYVWRAQTASAGEEASFVGAARDCPAELPHGWHISDTHLTWTMAGSATYSARRAGRYRGWVALARRHLDPKAGEDDYVFMADLRWHDEGFVQPILDAGEPTGYAVELARLTYQNTAVPVLKLGIIDQASGETLSYAWGAPGAARIGINLRWVQTGLTRE